MIEIELIGARPWEDFKVGSLLEVVAIKGGGEQPYMQVHVVVKDDAEDLARR